MGNAAFFCGSVGFNVNAALLHIIATYWPGVLMSAFSASLALLRCQRSLHKTPAVVDFILFLQTDRICWPSFVVNICAFFREVHDGGHCRHHRRGGGYRLHHRSGEIRRPQQQKVSMEGRLVEGADGEADLVAIPTEQFLKSEETLKPCHPF